MITLQRIVNSDRMRILFSLTEEKEEQYEFLKYLYTLQNRKSYD